MKILIFCWRDIKNPRAGGSEIYFHELSKRWTKMGTKVTMICSAWKGCKTTEIIEGVNIIRVGNPLSLYFLSPKAYRNLEEKPDVIIDVENGLPFFTPLFAKERKILHIHHIHKDVWFKELNPLYALIGRFLEMKIMPLIYKNTKVITLSKSSKEEIERELHLNVSGVVNPGINFIKYKKYNKSKNPTILFLNRIKKYKGIKVLLDAALKLNKYGKSFEILIAGEGDALKEMKEYSFKKRIPHIKFLGKIDEEMKKKLMQESWIFVNPSFKEGWGIVNIEANYLGLPVIGSNVAGIKDSVINGKTGLLFKYGDSNQLAREINYLISHKNLLKRLSENAKIWSFKFNRYNKAKEYLNLIKEYK